MKKYEFEAIQNKINSLLLNTSQKITGIWFVEYTGKNFINYGYSL